MAAVIIGVDPHKGSHTAVATGGSERQPGRLRVRASESQAIKLAERAAAWPDRTWAVEGAGGLGHLLAQQLVAAGERVLDIQPKLGSRVRLLSSGRANKNDPNDALSVAVAGLRSPRRREVPADGPATALKLWARRHRGPGPAPQPDRLPAPQPARQPGPRRHRRRDHPRPGRPAPGRDRAVRPGRPGAPPARRRAHRGPAPARRPAAPDPGTARRRGQRMRHQPDGGAPRFPDWGSFRILSRKGISRGGEN